MVPIFLAQRQHILHEKHKSNARLHNSLAWELLSLGWVIEAYQEFPIKFPQDFFVEACHLLLGFANEQRVAIEDLISQSVSLGLFDKLDVLVLLQG